MLKQVKTLQGILYCLMVSLRWNTVAFNWISNLSRIYPLANYNVLDNYNVLSLTWSTMASHHCVALFWRVIVYFLSFACFRFTIWFHLYNYTIIQYTIKHAFYCIVLYIAYWLLDVGYILNTYCQYTISCTTNWYSMLTVIFEVS